MEVNDKFWVHTIRSGQKDQYEDKVFEYEVESREPEEVVRKWCMTRLMESYPRKEMPNPFTGELVEFTNVNNYYKGKAVPEDEEPELYRYVVRKMYTG